MFTLWSISCICYCYAICIIALYIYAYTYSHMITKQMQRNTIDYGRLSANMIEYCGPTFPFTDNRCLAEQVLLSIGLFMAAFQLQWYNHFELYHGVAIHIHIRVVSEYIRLASLKEGADSPWIVAFNSDFYKNTLMRFLTSGQHPNGHRDLARLNCTSLKQESTFLHRHHLHAKHYTRKMLPVEAGRTTHIAWDEWKI